MSTQNEKNVAPSRHYLEVLDTSGNVVSAHRLTEGLTLLGRSPGAHVHLNGKDIGALHVAIKAGERPIIMDLGGPSPLKVNGKELIEYIFDSEDATLDIGDRRVRVRRSKAPLQDLRVQAWEPVTDGKSTALTIRVRLYVKGVPQEALNSKDEFILGEQYGLNDAFRMVYREGKRVLAQVPQEWVNLGGRIQPGKKGIAKLTDWAQPIELERDTVYRVQAGQYLVEILVSTGGLVIGGSKIETLPPELRKPFAVSFLSFVLVFGIWLMMISRDETKVEEPYPVYARIQNIPVEKIPDPEPSSDLQAGGGSGSIAKETTAPQVGAPAQSAPSAAAQALTGGLKNLFGSVLSQSKVSSGAVVAESGVATAAAVAAGGATQTAGKLAAVGQGAANVVGAAKLGKLAIKGSGQGFSGGSGTGLGTGHGNGIGTGVGDGIGRGGFRLVEEESIVDGGLDKSVIAAVIQNNLSQIKYCYERQLVAEPDLFGKVVALWHINAAGRVESPSVKQTTLNSPPVENCMMSKIAGWKFPKPKNGTRVTVSYPFLFKSTK